MLKKLLGPRLQYRGKTHYSHSKSPARGWGRLSLAKVLAAQTQRGPEFGSSEPTEKLGTGTLVLGAGRVGREFRGAEGDTA